MLRALMANWWLVVLLLLAAVGLALVVDASQAVEYEATAGLIVEDPRASRLFEVTDLGRPSTQASERYLADQVEILRSAEIANAASVKLDGAFSSRYFRRNTKVAGDLNSNLIEVSFTAPSQEEAQLGADAVAIAYQELRRQQVQDTAAVALAKVEALLGSLDLEIAEVDRRITESRQGDPTLQELERQFDEARGVLNDLRLQRNLLAADSEERATINAQIAELLADFATWEVVLRISERGSELENLLAEKDAAVAEKATLVARANSISVDAELAAGGVALFSPAPLPTEPSKLSLQVILALAIALGLIASAIVAYYLALRRYQRAGSLSLVTFDADDREATLQEGPSLLDDRWSRATTHTSPGAVLDAPLLAEVPRVDSKEMGSATVVLDAPGSAAAAAFGRAASMIEVRATASGATTLFVVSATPGTGRTTFVANTGLAAAAQGLRTLLVDADFAKPDLTRMLVRTPRVSDLVDVMEGSGSIEDALSHVELSGDQTLAVLSGGRRYEERTNPLVLERTKALFVTLQEDFDLILVDGPPILEDANANILVQSSDGVIVLVTHGSNTRDIQGVADHLVLIDIPTLGYVAVEELSRQGSARRESAGVAQPFLAGYEQESVANPWPRSEGTRS